MESKLEKILFSLTDSTVHAIQKMDLAWKISFRQDCLDNWHLV